MSEEQDIMVTIRGRKERGAGAASRNLPIQFPLIAEQVPTLKGCFAGTINLKLDEGLLVVHPDFRTTPIAWSPKHSSPGEIFDLLRIELEAPVGAKPIPAWIYVAHHSDHRRSLRTHEVVCALVPGLSDGCECVVQLERSAERIELGYRKLPVLWIV